MASRLHVLALVCVAAAADTGAQTTTWRQCLADNVEKAIAACTSIIFLDPTDDGAYLNRGIAYRRGGDLDRAMRDYDEAIRLNPRAADAYNNRGNAHRERHDYERAMDDYDTAIQLNPRYAHAYNNRGIVSLELGNAGLAVTDFSRAIEEDPGYAAAYRNRGLARTDQRLFSLALEDFDKAFSLNPELGRGSEYALALFGRGQIRRRRGDPAGLRDIETAKRLLPEVEEIMSAPDTH